MQKSIELKLSQPNPISPTWAMLGGILASASLDVYSSWQIVLLWCLVNPLLSTIQNLLTQPRKSVVGVQLAFSQPKFALPYTQAHSKAAQWITDNEFSRQLLSLSVFLIATLAISLSLNFDIFILSILAVIIILILRDISQPFIQILIPYLMGASLWSSPNWLVIFLALSYWLIGVSTWLRDNRVHWAKWGIFAGQIAVIGLFLWLRILLSASILSMLCLAQSTNQPNNPFAKFKFYSTISLLIASISIGFPW